MPTAPTVAVIVPVYNGAATIARTLASVREQEGVAWRCVVVDDGSTDGSGAIAAAATRGDGRTTVVTQGNRGLAAARNRGLDELRAGPAPGFVSFLDADDALRPGALRDLTGRCDRAGADAACGAWALCDAELTPTDCVMRPPPSGVSIAGLLGGNRVAPHSHIIRWGRVAEERFDESLPVVEDYDLWLRLAGRGLRWAATGAIVADYRVRPGSLSKSASLMLDTFALVRRRAEDRLLPHERDAARLAAVLAEHAVVYATVGVLCGPLAQASGLGGQAPVAQASGLCALAPVAQASGLCAPHIGAQAPDQQSPAADATGPHDLNAVFGRSAAWALRLGLGLSTDRAVAGAAEWAPRLVAWWKNAAARGWVRDPAAALHALAATLVPPERVAVDLVARRAGSPGLVVMGLGQNGARVIEAAGAAGLAVDARDDRAEAGGAPIGSPLPRGWPVIVTPEADSGLIARLPAGTPALRWVGARAELAAGLLARLTAASDAWAELGASRGRASRGGPGPAAEAVRSTAPGPTLPR